MPGQRGVGSIGSARLIYGPGDSVDAEIEGTGVLQKTIEKSNPYGPVSE